MFVLRVLKNRANIFYSLSVKYEPISIKIESIVPEETLNTTYLEWPLHLKYVLALPWEI